MCFSYQIEFIFYYLFMSPQFIKNIFFNNLFVWKRQEAQKTFPICFKKIYIIQNMVCFLYCYLFISFFYSTEKSKKNVNPNEIQFDRKNVRLSIKNFRKIKYSCINSVVIPTKVFFFCCT